MTRRSVGPLAIALLSLAGVALACHKGEATDPCLPIVNGVVIYDPGLHLIVRDRAGQGEALGDTVIVYSGKDSTIDVGYDTLQIYAGYHSTGTFSARVKRRYYADGIVPSFRVEGAACGGITPTTVLLTLQVAPGAPALRSIGIFGSTFVNGPGATNQLTTRFDADASVPRSVLWRLSDTTAARIDANGVLTGKCITKSRSDTVTALALADTNVRAKTLFSVATQPSCP